jgi:thiol:disulfide interchange protein
LLDWKAFPPSAEKGLNVFRPFVGGLAAFAALAIGCTQSETAPTEDAAATVAIGASDSRTPAPEASPATPAPKLYDTTADGFAQVDAALAEAKPAGKRVILQFGAEWCGWCHRLHRLLESDEQIGAVLEANYVVVLIDVDGDHNQAVNEKYGNPTQHGLPVLVVLDADGTPLTTQDTAELEKGNAHDPAKVLAFLNQWAPGGEADGESLTQN